MNKILSLAILLIVGLSTPDFTSGKLKMTAKDRDDYVAVLRTLPAKWP